MSKSLTQLQRSNLDQLATYLEGLPADYEHFDMDTYLDHRGSCGVFDDLDAAYSKAPQETLANCGTVACAVGHGPAAGIPLREGMLLWGLNENGDDEASIDWSAYAELFVPCVKPYPGADIGGMWPWVFGPEWSYCDNSHRSAAARIRYLLDKGDVPAKFKEGWRYAAFMPDYQPYLVA